MREPCKIRTSPCAGNPILYRNFYFSVLTTPFREGLVRTCTVNIVPLSTKTKWYGQQFSVPENQISSKEPADVSSKFSRSWVSFSSIFSQSKNSVTQTCFSMVQFGQLELASFSDSSWEVLTSKKISCYKADFNSCPINSNSSFDFFSNVNSKHAILFSN